MTLRVLLAESDTEDVLFLRDVLEDMESCEFWSGWLHLDIHDAPTWSFAEEILASEPIDIILLDLNLPDAPATTGFRRAQAAAPHVPVVLLIEDADLDLANRLIREGAQDFLIKKNIDCEPLAHALRNAVERQRLLAAARAAAMTDPLTGLLNRAAFQVLAERDRRLAEAGGRRMGIVIAEPVDAVSSRSTPHTTQNSMLHTVQQRDLAMVEAADRLRSVAGPADLVARLSEERFAISLCETDTESVEQACGRYQATFGTRFLRTAAAVFNPYRPATLDALLEQAEDRLTVPAAAARA